MSDFEPVTPGPAFQAEWAKWQKQLREWRQAYDEWRQVLQQLQEWDEKESKGIQLPSIDPNFDVFGVENILDIGEGEPLFGNFEYEDWLLLSTRVELHLLVHHFRDDTGGAVLDESNLAHYYKCYFKKNFKPEDFAVKTAEEVILLVEDSVCIENALLEHKLPENTSWLHFLKSTEQPAFEKQMLRTSVRQYCRRRPLMDTHIRRQRDCATDRVDGGALPLLSKDNARQGQDFELCIPPSVLRLAIERINMQIASEQNEEWRYANIPCYLCLSPGWALAQSTLYLQWDPDRDVI
ncbi:SUB2 [Symbiodinium sp. KB8]|nr:SUB2 [Symbiodinium sp. KB8]